VVWELVLGQLVVDSYLADRFIVARRLGLDHAAGSSLPGRLQLARAHMGPGVATGRTRWGLTARAGACACAAPGAARLAAWSWQALGDLRFRLADLDARRGHIEGDHLSRASSPLAGGSCATTRRSAQGHGRTCAQFGGEPGTPDGLCGRGRGVADVVGDLDAGASCGGWWHRTVLTPCGLRWPGKSLVGG
jgi:hypothetical protein